MAGHYNRGVSGEVLVGRNRRAKRSGPGVADWLPRRAEAGRNGLAEGGGSGQAHKKSTALKGSPKRRPEACQNIKA
jgi:hypothetical protein